MACAHFFLFNGGVRRRRWLQIVFGRRTVHVPAKSKSDKTHHHQPGSGYYQPMRILHGYYQPMRILHLGEPCHLPFALMLNRDLPSEIRRVQARDLTADRVRPNCVAISTARAFEMMSFRNSSSSSEVQAFALFTFFIAFLGVKESCAITPC